MISSLKSAIGNYINQAKLDELVNTDIDIDTWLDSLQCNAKTRAGDRCTMRAKPGSTKCNLHGAKSTGPKTEEGKAKALANLKQYRNKKSTD